MICLDTTFLIDLLRGEKSACRMSEELDYEHMVFTTEVNIFEVTLGIFANKNINQEKDLAKAKELFRILKILPLDHESAMEAGRIAGDLIRRGKQIDDNDCMTAAIAKMNGIDTIMTRNEGHYKLAGLNVKVY